MIYRQPSECVIAYYLLCCAIGCYNGSKEDFIELFMTDWIPYLPFVQHHISYNEFLSCKDNILGFEYTRDKSAMRSVEDSIADICRFLGKPVPCADIMEKVKLHLEMYSDSDGLEIHDQEFRMCPEQELKFNNWLSINGHKKGNFFNRN